jgi:SAM-dependent methyltransferase
MSDKCSTDMTVWMLPRADAARIAEMEALQAYRWDHRADPTYYERWRSQKACQFTDELYLEYLRGKSFLEVGCGEGHLMTKMRQRHPAARFTGVDISRLNVERCRRRGFLDVFVGSGNRLEFPDATFDAVFAGVWVMRYLHPHQSLREIYRVLRPGGQVAFDLPFLWGHCFCTVVRLLHTPPRRWRESIADAYLHLDGRSVAAWRRRLRQTGFRVLDVVGGIDAPIRSQMYGFRRRQRGTFGLMMSSIVWFRAEKPFVSAPGHNGDSCIA